MGALQEGLDQCSDLLGSARSVTLSGDNPVISIKRGTVDGMRRKGNRRGAQIIVLDATRLVVCEIIIIEVDPRVKRYGEWHFLRVPSISRRQLLTVHNISGRPCT